MADLYKLLASLSDDNNVRGRQFERICKWYLLHDPAYGAQLNRVWLWKD